MAYLLNRGVSAEVQREFGIEEYGGFVRFPVRLSSGDCVGTILRHTDERQRPKYVIQGFLRKYVLYGMYEARPYVNDEIVLVEGPVDVLALASLGLRNVVAYIGSVISHPQVITARRYAECAVWWPDPDIRDEEKVKVYERSGRTLRTWFKDKVSERKTDTDPADWVREYLWR